MVTCTAMASGILLANLPGNLPFLPQDPVQLRIHELIPLAQMFPLAAFIAHAELLQNPAGRGIVLEMRGEDAMQTEVFESVAQDFTRGLGGVALAPVWNAQPVAQFAVLMLRLQAQADAADLASVSPERDR